MKKTALFKKILIGATAAFLTLFSSNVFAEYNSIHIPDSAEIRNSIIETWLTAPLSELRSRNSEIVTNNYGTVFRVSYNENDNFSSIIIAPKSSLSVDVISETETKTVVMDVYPEGAPGSWVLVRDKNNGNPICVKWYFNPDSDIVLTLRPDGNKTFVDLGIYGFYSARSVPLGIPFNKVYSLSFERIFNLTKQSVPWNNIKINFGQYHETLQMIYYIREKATSIDFNMDACYNKDRKLYSILKNKPLTYLNDEGKEEPYIVQEGRLVLGYAGFVKWIIDGIIEPRTGHNSDINEMTVPTIEYNPIGRNGVIEQSWNLSFACDWNRNLSAKALSVRSSRDFNWKNGGVDVNIEPFVTSPESTGYIKDTGYNISNLEALMYVLCSREPGYFYLGAVKEQSKKLGDDEYIFNYSCALFPYFDDNGKFDCVVFEAGKEYKISDYMKNHANSFIHLERVKSTEDFYPQ